MERRDLEAVVALAEERHFGRAAERLHMSTPSLSELIRRLEAELGTALFVRTTRRVAITETGTELLARARRILDEFAAAAASVRLIESGECGLVRLGVCPPAAHGLVPFLLAQAAQALPRVTVDKQVMWRPDLVSALDSKRIEVALSFGNVRKRDGVAGRVLCAQPVVVALRRDHPLAGRRSINLSELKDKVLGVRPPQLFPAWAAYQRHVLKVAGIAPPTALLNDHSIEARRWTEQEDVEWTLMMPVLATGHRDAVTVFIDPPEFVPLTLEWRKDGSEAPVVQRLVDELLAAELPSDWHLAQDDLELDAVVVA